MLHLIREGDKVKVWPRPGHTVASAPPVAVQVPVTKDNPTGVQMMAARPVRPEGEVVVWTLWHHERARSGDLMFSDPHAGGGVQHAHHVRHPHECGADGKPAIEGGAHSRHEFDHWHALGHDKARLSDKVLAAEKAEAEKAAAAEKAEAEKAAAEKAEAEKAPAPGEKGSA